MRLVNYRSHAAGLTSVGVLENEHVVDAASLLARVGEDPAHAASMERLIQLPRETLRRLGEAARDGAGRRTPLSEVRLEAPIRRPSKVIGLGYNYRALCENEGVTPGPEPELFVKMPTSITGPFDPVVVPKVIDKVDFEAELAVVIGRRCSQVEEHEALDYVGGYTVMDDVTAKIIPRPPESGSVVLALKGVDTFAPIGPAILVADDSVDPQGMRIRCRVNGVQKQDFHSSDMVHTVAQVIEYISARITLEPGDLITTGTSLGIGIIQKPPVFLEDGDVVECEIEGIGTIRNEFVLRHVRG
ncbi:MAG TPA: fumarylacetoacetate hydrolase family protein [Trueperaceae bacterium]|jgi:2-keto-4-pentenoate hydratase/2-oxohepta-3-ene-1,7-dioic acid hydratase in catechol pathway